MSNKQIAFFQRFT